MRKDELAGQPQAVPMEERSERYAAERLSSNARLIPTIAFDWTVAPRTTVYITAPSPAETAALTDYLAAPLRGPRAAAFADQAAEVSTAPVLMKERIGRQESAFSHKTKRGNTSTVVGISFIALALSGLSWAFNFFGIPKLHLSRPPISAIGGAPPGSEPVAWAGASSTLGDEAAVAPKVVSGAVQASLAAIPHESPPIPTAISPGSEATDPPLPFDEALARTSIPSASERADPLAPRDEKLARPTAIPSEPASPTLLQDTASASLIPLRTRRSRLATIATGTAADSGRRPQRVTNIVTIRHHTATSLQASSAHARRRSALCQATQGAKRCAPLRRIRARGPTAHGAAGIGPSAQPWNRVPGRFP